MYTNSIKIKATEDNFSKSASINDIFDAAYAIQDASADYTLTDVQPGEVAMNDDGTFSFLANGWYGMTKKLTAHSLNQLCTRIGVPAPYVAKCFDAGMPDLGKENFNRWLVRYCEGSRQRNWFLRTYEDEVRGALTDRYTVCDAPEILERVFSTINSRDFSLVGSVINPEIMHLRLTWPKQLIDGEDLFPALFITSSDVGRASISIQFGIFKLACTNGLVISRAGGDIFKQKHIGIGADELIMSLESSVENIDILKENAAQWVRFSKEHPEEGIDKDSYAERLKKQLAISEKSAKSIIDLMKTKYGTTRWGLINSITEAAQAYNLEKRIDLEKTAGKMLITAA